LLYLLLKLNMLCILCSSGSNLAEACFQGSLVTCHEKQLEFIRTLKLASKLQSQAPLLPYSTRDCWCTYSSSQWSQASQIWDSNVGLQYSKTEVLHAPFSFLLVHSVLVVLVDFLAHSIVIWIEKSLYQDISSSSPLHR
jgi:hypothetical protein